MWEEYLQKDSPTPLLKLIYSCSCSHAHEITSLQIPIKTKLTRNFDSNTKNETTRIIRKNNATRPINAIKPIGVTESTKPTNFIESIDVIKFTSSIEFINATRVTKPF